MLEALPAVLLPNSPPVVPPAAGVVEVFATFPNRPVGAAAGVVEDVVALLAPNAPPPNKFVVPPAGVEPNKLPAGCCAVMFCLSAP